MIKIIFSYGFSAMCSLIVLYLLGANLTSSEYSEYSIFVSLVASVSVVLLSYPRFDVIIKQCEFNYFWHYVLVLPLLTFIFVFKGGWEGYFLFIFCAYMGALFDLSQTAYRMSERIGIMNIFLNIRSFLSVLFVYLGTVLELEVGYLLALFYLSYIVIFFKPIEFYISFKRTLNFSLHEVLCMYSEYKKVCVLILTGMMLPYCLYLMKSKIVSNQPESDLIYKLDVLLFVLTTVSTVLNVFVVKKVFNAPKPEQLAVFSFVWVFTLSCVGAFASLADYGLYALHYQSTIDKYQFSLMVFVVMFIIYKTFFLDNVLVSLNCEKSVSIVNIVYVFLYFLVFYFVSDARLCLEIVCVLTLMIVMLEMLIIRFDRKQGVVVALLFSCLLLFADIVFCQVVFFFVMLLMSVIMLRKVRGYC